MKNLTGASQATVRKSVYWTQRWRRLRIRVLERDGWLCVSCQDKDRIEFATVVDHITEITQGGDPWAMENLRSMCRPCHEARHKRGENAERTAWNRFVDAMQHGHYRGGHGAICGPGEGHITK